MSAASNESGGLAPHVGTKRALPIDDVLAGVDQEKAAPTSPPHSSSTATSAFRNVSACNRCRVRKNRCDQVLPACSACTKANVRCVGYDPITKREIPRSYVYFLETRLAYFEDLLKGHQVPYDPAEVFDADSRVLGGKENTTPSAFPQHEPAHDDTTSSDVQNAQKKQDDEKLDDLVSNIGMVSVQGTSEHRYLGATSGISFARVVLAAVRRSSMADGGDRSGSKLTKPTTSGGDSMRDSYFGLQTRSQFREAPFPDRDLGEKLITLYFEYANPQIPILHRDEFISMFDRVYSPSTEQRTPRELYLLNIVYAIGAAIIWGSSDPEHGGDQYAPKRARLDGQQAQPEEYHAAACVHLTSFLNSGGMPSLVNATGGGTSDLEELQAVLLLASFALLRPIAPGLWYIVGVAMRLAIDLGLHYEDGTGLSETDLNVNVEKGSKRARQLGRRQWMRDYRRRLWWCTYAFDRLVSTCVGRPFGITDQVITTEFPSLLDDKYITKEGIAQGVPADEPSYKRVANHYLRLRLLQSEIVQVLQYEQARMARMNGWNRHNDFMHTKLPSPFLAKHSSFRSWRKDVDQRLFEWKESAPLQAETGVSFLVQFLELNYWQAVTMLYRQSLSVPAPFAGELSPTEDITSPSSVFTEDKEDEDLVFLKCAEAGQKTLKIYRQMHRLRLVNYTYLATHHLFMAGISFLYAVWHSPAVRSRITLDDFDFTVLAATSVLGDLMAKCPPAEACRDAFERMSKATVQMCMSSPGFGFGSKEESNRVFSEASTTSHNASPQQGVTMGSTSRPMKRPPPKFDMDLRDLFPDGVNTTSRTKLASRPRSNAQRGVRKPRGSISRKMPQSHEAFGPQSMHFDIPMQDSDPAMMQASLAGYPPSQQQQQQQQQLQYNTSPNLASQMNYQVETIPTSYNPDFMSNLPDMDFLNHLSTSAGNQASHIMTQSPGANPPGPHQMDLGLDDGWLDVGPSNADGDADSDWGLGSGFGVGVGMGLDFGPNHDWSDGQGQGGLNMFDGFFFGGDDGSNL